MILLAFSAVFVWFGSEAQNQSKETRKQQKEERKNRQDTNKNLNTSPNTVDTSRSRTFDDTRMNDRIYKDSLRRADSIGR